MRKKNRYNAKQKRLLELGKIPKKENIFEKYKRIREKQDKVLGLTAIELIVLHIIIVYGLIIAFIVIPKINSNNGYQKDFYIPKEIRTFNKQYEKYNGMNKSGKEVKEVLKLVIENNAIQSEKNIQFGEEGYKTIEVLFYVDEQYTNSGKIIYTQTMHLGTIESFINEIIEEKQYNIQILKLNSEGYVSLIRISDENTYNLQ